MGLGFRGLGARVCKQESRVRGWEGGGVTAVGIWSLKGLRSEFEGGSKRCRGCVLLERLQQSRKPKQGLQ